MIVTWKWTKSKQKWKWKWKVFFSIGLYCVCSIIVTAIIHCIEPQMHEFRIYFRNCKLYLRQLYSCQRGARNNCSNNKTTSTKEPTPPPPMTTVTNFDRRISCLPTNQLHLITGKSIKIFANACIHTHISITHSVKLRISIRNGFDCMKLIIIVVVVSKNIIISRHTNIRTNSVPPLCWKWNKIPLISPKCLNFSIYPALEEYRLCGWKCL